MALAHVLPRGGVLIYRHFGQPDLTLLENALRIARRRGVLVLIGADWRLAARVRADGVHLPERQAWMAARLRRRRPDWLVTAAAHSPKALRRADGAHAALLSPVFPTASASGGTPIGMRRAAGWARAASVPVIALGGVTAARAARLTGFAGLAAIEAWLTVSPEH